MLDDIFQDEDDGIAEFEDESSLQKDFILFTQTHNYFIGVGLICQ